MSINPVAMPFITVWETTSDDNNITIPINADYKSDYNYTVNWGDGIISKNINDSTTHTYSSEGNHTVKISGVFPAIRMISSEKANFKTSQEETNAKKLQKVTQWGNIKWSSFQNAFAWCSNLDINATDTPALSNVRSTSNMFKYAYNLKGNRYFNDWDVSSVTYMGHMFYYAKAFNQPLNNWDVSSVTYMGHMFYNANTFNQALNKWDVSSVTFMSHMFYNAKAFNQPLNNWNVSSVTNMAYMFSRATVFNQALNNWDVSSITEMGSMFEDAKAFNQPLDKWDVSSVTYMGNMFAYTKVFNQPLNNWDVSSVTSMVYMFTYAEAFNQALDNWNVRSVTDMRGMFQGAKSFTNQDLGTWLVIDVPSDKHGKFIKDAGIRNTEPTWNK
jgi:surface protein